MPGVLTRELVIARSKVDNLSAIKSLNAWGNDIEDVQILKQLPNVEVLSLSVNRISSLRDFSRCHKLQELYLRKNNIENLGELLHIANLPVLRVLWLNENPCANAKNYREKVIKMLPCLVKLDDQPITNDERRLVNQVELEAFEEVAEEHSAEIDLYFSPIEQQKQQYLYEQQIDRNEIPIKALKNRNIKPWSNKRTAANTPKAKKQEVFGEYSSSEREKMATPPSGEKENRNSASKSEYLVSAVLNLLEVLDLSSLEFLKEDIEKKISIRKMSP